MNRLTDLYKTDEALRADAEDLIARLSQLGPGVRSASRLITPAA